MPVALNVDGLERKRKKWNKLAKAGIMLSEWLATFCPTTVIVRMPRTIAEYYRERYGKATTFIPYGADLGTVESTGTLEALGLEPGEYFLYVSRLEPENNALLVREAFEQVVHHEETSPRLATLRTRTNTSGSVRDTEDPRIVIPGAIYGQGYHELQSHCFAYIHATEVGGTHPALIEAMGRGASTLYSTPWKMRKLQAGPPFRFIMIL